jgi:cysteine-rich repeat protein
MRRLIRPLAVLLALSLGRFAYAQVDCGADGVLCDTVKYGFGLSPDYRKDEIPPDPFRYTNDFFGPDLGGVSFFSSRSDLTGRVGNCGPQRLHAPLPGQVLLRERTDCAPSSQGPICTSGTAPLGSTCHLPTLNQGCTGAGTPLGCCAGAGTGSCTGFQTSAPNPLECGTGGICALDPGTGCRVEIPLSDGGVTPVEQTSEVSLFSLTYKAPAPNGDTYSLSANTGNTLGGTSDDSNPICLDENVRRRPTTGTRYLLSAARGGSGTETYVRWDSGAGIAVGDRDDLATSFRIHNDDSIPCCAATTPSLGTCCVVTPCFVPYAYPLLPQRNCGQLGRFVNEDNLTNDWLFEGGRGTRFYTDPDFEVPGAIPGICRFNRSLSCYRAGANAACTGTGVPFACCTGTGAGTCTEDCSGLDADPAAPGIQPDACDFRTPGHRVQVTCARDVNNNPRTDCCATAIYVLRATPDAGCSILPRYSYHGDPGPDCGLPNFGVDHRDDADCDGLADFSDLCPFYSEWDQDRDSDGDCSAPGGSCRGDECECGDQAGSGFLSGTVELGNGLVNVPDLVGINAAIFGSRVRKRLCDTTGDSGCTVSDIVGANREIFDADSSICRHITPRPCFTGVPNPCCGNAVREPGESCDDGNRSSGDGCSAICRVE